MEFVEFPKLARLSRECIISEKLDGTNAQIFIIARHEVPKEHIDNPTTPFLSVTVNNEDFLMVAGSRNQYISQNNDNYGFGRWVSNNREELVKLGPGRHFGEWWGNGIQRGYNLKEKRFSLFNTIRWCLYGQTPQLVGPQRFQEVLPNCVGLVPVLYKGIFTTDICENALNELKEKGSLASPGFMNPEGIVCYHIAANMGFKKTIKNDEQPKSLVK